MYLKHIALRATPPAWREPLRALRDRCFQWVAAGSNRWCPLCERRFGRFLSGGRTRRAEAVCPHCRSLERHRLTWLFMQRRTDLLDGRSKRLLHFAPANALRARLRRIPNLQYVTGDLASADLALRLDITQLPFSDGAFDAVYCSHVLEHVEQDRRALAEIARVLRPGGWALLLVPIEGATTHEDPSIDTPRGRLRAFGQEDHVRLYGRDFTERVAATGLVVEAVPYGAELGADAASEMGLAQDEIIHFCRKPAG